MFANDKDLRAALEDAIDGTSLARLLNQLLIITAARAAEDGGSGARLWLAAHPSLDKAAQIAADKGV